MMLRFGDHVVDHDLDAVTHGIGLDDMREPDPLEIGQNHLTLFGGHVAHVHVDHGSLRFCGTPLDARHSAICMPLLGCRPTPLPVLDLRTWSCCLNGGIDWLCRS